MTCLLFHVSCDISSQNLMDTFFVKDKFTWPNYGKKLSKVRLFLGIWGYSNNVV